MTPREMVLEQIQHHETRPLPYTLSIEEPVAQRLDEYYGGREWRGRLVQHIRSVHPIETMRKDPISQTHARDTYGAIWRTDLRPFHLEKPPLPDPTLDGYEFPKPERFFVPERKEEVRRVCEANRDSFLTANLGWGLFELSWNLRGFENALMDSICEPDFYEALLDKATELYLAFVEYVADLPIDGIMFGDDWGDQRGVIIGPGRWRRLLKPRWARLYQQVHASGRLVISHCCGNVTDIMPDIVEIGLDVLESCQPEAMDVYELKRRYGGRITFWGGLGTQRLIPFGTPAEIRREVRRLCEELGRGGGYILAPAKALQPETPTANAVAVVEAFTNQDA